MKMKNFLIKSIVILIIVLALMANISYIMDPSNLFDMSMTRSIASNLLAGNAVEITGNYEERLVQQEIAKQTTQKVDTLILGSSHVMYIPLEKEENLRNTGVSACELWDLYGIMGMYEYYDILPEKVIIGVDPWIFNENSGGTRYKEISGFVEYEKNNILGKETRKNVEHSNRFTNLKELVNVSYFQSSFRALRVNGLQNSKGKMMLAEDREVGNGTKICSNGTRIPAYSFYQSMEEIEAGIEEMTHGSPIYNIEQFEEVSQDTKIWFERFISYLQEKEIEVVLYMPVCYPTEVYQYVASTPKYNNVVEVEKYLLEYAEIRDISIYGF